MMGRVLHMMNGNRGKGVICVFFALSMSLFCVTRIMFLFFVSCPKEWLPVPFFFFFGGGVICFFCDYLSHQLQ